MLLLDLVVDYVSGFLYSLRYFNLSLVCMFYLRWNLIGEIFIKLGLRRFFGHGETELRRDLTSAISNLRCCGSHALAKLVSDEFIWHVDLSANLDHQSFLL